MHSPDSPNRSNIFLKIVVALLASEAELFSNILKLEIMRRTVEERAIDKLDLSFSKGIILNNQSKVDQPRGLEQAFNVLVNRDGYFIGLQSDFLPPLASHEAAGNAKDTSKYACCTHTARTSLLHLASFKENCHRLYPIHILICETIESRSQMLIVSDVQEFPRHTHLLNSTFQCFLQFA